jgi:hypothetical protein
MREMIEVLARTHAVEKYVEDLGVWAREVFRLTQGNPMLADIVLKNANKFPDCRELREIREVMESEKTNVVNEVMRRLLHENLSEEESRILIEVSRRLHPLAEIPDVCENVEKVVKSIIDKGLLEWKDDKLMFTSEAVKVLVEVETGKMTPAP